jgi:hypothetical protein
MKNIMRLIAFATVPALLAAIWMLSPAADAYETTTTTESTTTTTVVTTTTTIPTTTVPTPTYNATASAQAKCDDTGNVVVSVSFSGDALDDGGDLLIMLDDIEVADLVYSSGEVIIEEAELSLNTPATNGGVVTFVMNTSFGDFVFTATWPAVPLCPQTSSTSIVRNAPGPSYTSTPTEVVIKAPKEPRFTG